MSKTKHFFAAFLPITIAVITIVMFFLVDSFSANSDNINYPMNQPREISIWFAVIALILNLATLLITKKYKYAVLFTSMLLICFIIWQYAIMGMRITF